MRRQRGLSQAQLAHPELSDSYVSLIESGKRTPTAAVLELLAAKLECSLTYLINGVTAEQMQDLELGLRYAGLALNNGEAAEARRRYAELLEDGSLTGLPALRRQAEYGFALTAEACGDLDQAIDVLSRLCASGGAGEGEGSSVAVVLALSRCYRERGRLGDAVRIAEEVLLAVKRPAWNDDLVELGATLIAAYINRGDLLRARQFTAELLAAAEMLGTPRAIVAAYWNAAIVAEAVGQGEEALGLVERALAIHSENGEPRNLARLRNALALLLLRVRPAEAETSRQLLLRARGDLTGSSASVADLGRCMLALSMVEIVLGHPETAVEHAREAVGMLDDRTWAITAESRLMLGTSLLMLDRQGEASEALNAVGEFLQCVPASRNVAADWLSVATVLEGLGDEEGSVTAYQRALTCVGL